MVLSCHATGLSLLDKSLSKPALSCRYHKPVLVTPPILILGLGHQIRLASLNPSIVSADHTLTWHAVTGPVWRVRTQTAERIFSVSRLPCLCYAKSITCDVYLIPSGNVPMMTPTLILTIGAKLTDYTELSMVYSHM